MNLEVTDNFGEIAKLAEKIADVSRTILHTNTDIKNHRDEGGISKGMSGIKFQCTKLELKIEIGEDKGNMEKGEDVHSCWHS